MKKVSIEVQIKRSLKRAIATDKTILQMKDDIELLKHISVENSKLLAKHDRILENHSRQLEDLNTKVGFLLEGMSEIIRDNREFKQQTQKIDPLAIESELLKTIFKTHVSDRKVHINMN